MKKIKDVLRKVVTEDYDQEMSGTRKRGEYTPTPREKEVSGVFGDYAEDVPPSVLRYMRKNPEAIVKRLHGLYGDRIFDYIKGDREGIDEGFDSPELMLNHIDNYMEYFKGMSKAIKMGDTVLDEMQDDKLHDELAPIVDELVDISHDIDDIMSDYGGDYSGLADRVDQRFGGESVPKGDVDINDYNPNE